MNIQTRIDAELERIRGFISPHFGERGPVVQIEPGKALELADVWEDRREVNESSLPISAGQFATFMPKLRSEKWLACLGLGKAFTWGIGVGDMQDLLFAKPQLFYMRERLQAADRTKHGFLLTCDHRVYTWSGRRLVFEIRLKWLHRFIVQNVDAIE
jgi:hypothetical protein